jgi:hypothetical protein
MKLKDWVLGGKLETAGASQSRCGVVLIPNHKLNLKTCPVYLPMFCIESIAVQLLSVQIIVYQLGTEVMLSLNVLNCEKPVSIP